MQNIIQWLNKDEYLYGSYNCTTSINDTNKNLIKIASFDLDGTLIKTKSNKTHPIDENDWILFNNYVKPVLKKLVDNNYKLILISNQKGIIKQNKVGEWTKKISLIAKELNLPFEIYVSLYDDNYRKPMPTIFNTLINNLNIIDIPQSFYCGDASGEKGTFSDTDLKFARNIKLKFFEPDRLFIKDFDNVDKIVDNYKVNSYVNFDSYKTEEYDIKNIETLIANNEKIIILMCGLPGSGKSSFTKNKLLPLNFVSINQDTLKTAKKCISEATKLIKANKNIVIDNTNSSKKTRNEYINIAKDNGYKVVCFIMNTPKELCIHNNYYRHFISNGQIKLVPDIVYNIYKKNYEEPSTTEGIFEIIKLNFALNSNTNKNENYFLYYH